MTKINILPPLLADMIAAGEVVERPASVIKELMENAFDAGAKKVTVEFKRGGSTYIRVTDDGCGMSPEDAGLAFTRHATSKLRDVGGLEAISTMGFRGEALAAISAVSKVELVTRERGESEGVCVTVAAGDIVDMLPCGCPEGTSITVRDIFFNTPARLKFLKSDRAEAAACTAAALRCALGRPEISVRCIRDGAEEFFTPGDGRAESAAYSLLGRDCAGSLLPCRGESEGMKLQGFTSSPSAGRGSRSQQFFFCNGRYIKSALLQSAVEQAYKNTLLTGRFPACVMYLELGCAGVDVNVHPAKTEVKFSDEKKVFDLVYQTVRLALAGEERPAEIKLSEGTQKAVSQPRQDFYRTMSAEEYRSAAPKYDASSRRVSPAPTPTPTPAPLSPPSRPPLRSQEPTPAPSTRVILRTEPVYDSGPAYRAEPAPNVEKAPKTEPSYVENLVETVDNSAKTPYRTVGEALNTYIIVERGDELLLIDKHAAHERMIFDRLKEQGRSAMSQTLLMPITLRLNAQEAELIEKNGELLAELGFEIEPFGEREHIIRAVPADMDAAEARAAVEEICEKLRGGKLTDANGAQDEILHTVACKAAIKAGRRHEPEELARIAEAVCSGRVKYCPHGRPVSVALTKKELDKFFSRIV